MLLKKHGQGWQREAPPKNVGIQEKKKIHAPLHKHAQIGKRALNERSRTKIRENEGLAAPTPKETGRKQPHGS